MDVRFNVNNWVKVKLNDKGIRELERQHEELSAMLKRPLGGFSIEQDTDGYSKFQLHSLMNSFGHLMELGEEIPFDSEIILWCADEIKQ